jgi:hypothetical protein
MLWQSTPDIVDDGPRIDELRESIQANRISFPTPVPIFATQFRPEIQWRLVELYFIRGWSSKKLAERYGVTARRIQQSLQHWAARAMSCGYLQEIPPETVLVAPSAPAWISPTQPAMPMPMNVPFLPLPIAAAHDSAAQPRA